MKDNRFLYTARLIACLAVITIYAKFLLISNNDSTEMAIKPIMIMVICVILFYFVPMLVKKRIKMPSST